MKHTIAHVALLVRDYDEAIAYYTQTLGFTLVEDTYQPEQDKRWVIVAPAGRLPSSRICTGTGGTWSSTVAEPTQLQRLYAADRDTFQ